MSVKSELVESLLERGKSYALDTMKSLGNPLQMMNNGGAGALQRVAAGAVGGAALGIGVNATTGVLGAPLSMASMGYVSNDFSMGSMFSSGMRGAVAGAAIAGGGFKNVGGQLQMREGMRSVANTIGDIAGSMGVGLSASSKTGQKAMAGELGNGMIDQFAKSLRMKASDGIGGRVGAIDIGKKMSRMESNSSETLQNYSSRWLNESGQIDPHKASAIKTELGRDMYGKQAYAGGGTNKHKVVENGKINTNKTRQVDQRYSSLKEEELAAFNQAKNYQGASPLGKLEMVGGESKLLSNQAMKPPSMTDTLRQVKNSSFNNPIGAIGKTVGAGTLAMSMYQTNALGINLPSNRGYR